MAEKAIRLGGEATADAIVSAVDTMYSEHTFDEKDFVLKHNDDEIAVDSNFAAQSFWKDVRVRFFRKKSAVLGLIFVVFIVLLAAFGPGMNEYTYSGQELSQKNFAPRVQVLENLGIFNGDEKMSTTTGSKTVNAYVEKGKEDVYYWFGSDLYGRDIWTRTWEGARVSLIIAVAAAIIDMLIGMSYGLISGYFGGRVDMVMQRFLEVANGIPRLVIVTLLLLVLQPGMVTIIFALMLTEWGDRLLVVTSEKDAENLALLFGEQVQDVDWNNKDIDWNSIDRELVSSRILITKTEWNGKKLGSLKLRRLP